MFYVIHDTYASNWFKSTECFQFLEWIAEILEKSLENTMDLSYIVFVTEHIRWYIFFSPEIFRLRLDVTYSIFADFPICMHHGLLGISRAFRPSLI
jgi:hypothetical protein